LERMSYEDGISRLPRNVGNQCTLFMSADLRVSFVSLYWLAIVLNF
jgi:hypothetical protein